MVRYVLSLRERHKKCASGSAVEHLLAKEGVAGSIPVSRSLFFLKTLYKQGFFVFVLHVIEYILSTLKSVDESVSILML